MGQYLNIDDLQTLYQDHVKEISAFVYNFFKNPEETFDTTQDIFFKLFEHIQNQKIETTNPRAYIYKVARNHCIDVLKKKKIQTTTYEANSALLSNGRRSEAKIIDSLIIDSIYNYIENNLPETEATIFKLKFIYNFNLEEIVDVVGTSLSTVSRIIKKITLELEEKFPDIL